MNKFLNIGFDAFINTEKIILISSGDSEKIRREMKKRDIDKNSSKYWNACGGKEMKSVILMDDGMVVTSAVKSDTLASRYEVMVKGGCPR